MLCAALVSLTFVGCGDDSGSTNHNNSTCPEGYESQGPACVPIFDDCPGAAEIAVLGGGCRAVGVTACAAGLFEPDGEGGCEPILPPGPDPCPPGTMEILGQTGCQPVGVTECAVGFESDGADGCNAILPPGPDPCPSGTIALLGHTTCQPLDDCGTTTWGNIVDDPTTVYVDLTADATGAVGTALAPFTTIGEALAVVLPGGQIAIAAGDYLERLTISTPVRLTGRCVAQVTIRGQVFLGNPVAPVTITAGGTGSTISGVTLTGPAEGLMVSGAQQVVLNQLQVLDAADIGIVALEEAEVRLQRVVVAGNAFVGVFSSGASLDLEESVVRHTRPQPGTLTFGRGIHVQCNSAGDCGSLRVSSSLVSGNRDVGIYSGGVDTEVTATVVRDTLSVESTLTAGQGISALCSDAGICGSLRVSSSLVSGNRETGIAAGGVVAEIIDTVVRDTLSKESGGTFGRGIAAQCSPTGGCASLQVSSCVVAGNRDVGIYSAGMDAEVTSTVVRDTLPLESNDKSGRGISAECSSVGVCGTLWIVSSLVSGNRDGGIVLSGVDTEVTGTVVRDNLPEESEGLFGRGINAQCDPGLGGCGSLSLSTSLVSSNRDGGISVSGVDTEITASVVRDTLPQQLDGMFGRGINAQCSATGVCGSLLVSSSHVSGNRETGIFVAGVEAEVTSTVVRDTLPEQSSATSGRGISAQCHAGVAACGSLRVSSCLISGNVDVGVITTGVDTEVTATVVRDTLPEPSSGKFGRGINAQCYSAQACGSLRVSSGLISGNREVGIAAIGVHAEITDAVVRDTLAQQLTGTLGRGIGTQCDTEAGICAGLRVSSSLVQNNEDVGIFVAGGPASLEGVAVIDTWTNGHGPTQGVNGEGIWALCHPDTGDCGDLSMSSCLVDSSLSAGVALEGVSGFMATSVVRAVGAQPLDGRYGYGVQIGGLEGQQGQDMPTFNVNDCEIRNAKLAGILYFRARGTLSGSVVSGGENSVVMNEGSEPTILDSNQLSGTVTGEPTWANLFPSPAPAPSLPSSVEEER